MGFRKACFAPSISKLLASSAVEILRSPFLDYHFWRSEAKKVFGSRVTPDLHTQRMCDSNFSAGNRETEYD